MHPIPRALQHTIIHARPRPPPQQTRGFIVQLSDQATMIGDLRGASRAWEQQPETRLAETQIFTVHEHPAEQTPKVVALAEIVRQRPQRAEKREEHPLLAAAYGFFGVLLLGVPLLVHLFAG